MLDQAKIANAARELVGNLPDPRAPQIAVKDYEAYRNVAGRLFGNSRPTPDQVVQAHGELTGAQLSPSEFQRLWDLGKPLANRLLGRAPTVQELSHLQNASPGEVQQHYLDHPHPEYPEVAAGDLARYHHAATPIAMQTVGRMPTMLEAARFAIAGYGTEDIAAHYGSKS